MNSATFTTTARSPSCVPCNGYAEEIGVLSIYMIGLLALGLVVILPLVVVSGVGKLKRRQKRRLEANTLSRRASSAIETGDYHVNSWSIHSIPNTTGLISDAPSVIYNSGSEFSRPPGTQNFLDGDRIAYNAVNGSVREQHNDEEAETGSNYLIPDAYRVPVPTDNSRQYGKTRHIINTTQGVLNQPKNEASSGCKNRDMTEGEMMEPEKAYLTQSAYHGSVLYSVPYLEKYVDEDGGELHHPEYNVKLIVPPGALTEPEILSIAVINSDNPSLKIPSPDGAQLRVTPVIKCQPAGLKFLKPVTLLMPHCSIITDEEADVTAMSGDCIHPGNSQSSSSDSTIAWSKLDSAKIDGEHCHLSISHFTFFFCERKNMEGKVIQVLPFARLENEVMIHVWLCNKDGSIQQIRHDESTLMSKELSPHQDYVIYKTYQGLDVALKMTPDNNNGHWRVNGLLFKEAIPFDQIWHGARTQRIFRIDKGRPCLTGDLRIHQRENEGAVNFALQMPHFDGPRKDVLARGNEPELYRNLRQALVEKFTRGNCEMLAVFFNFGRAMIERIVERHESSPHEYPGDRLLAILQEKKLFGPNNVGPLRDACSKTNLTDAANLILRYRKESEVKGTYGAVPVPV